MADDLEASLSSEDAHRAQITAALPTPSPSWEVRPVKGATFELINAGTGSSYEVEVTADNAVRFDGPNMMPEWSPGVSHTIFAVASFQTGIPKLRVTWRSTPVDPAVQEWTCLLLKAWDMVERGRIRLQSAAAFRPA